MSKGATQRTPIRIVNLVQRACVEFGAVCCDIFLVRVEFPNGGEC